MKYSWLETNSSVRGMNFKREKDINITEYHRNGLDECVTHNTLNNRQKCEKISRPQHSTKTTIESAAKYVHVCGVKRRNNESHVVSIDQCGRGDK